MKGIVFTEFIEFVEDFFGFELAQHMIDNAHTPSNGVYSAVGTYNAEEMMSMLIALSKQSKTDIPKLLNLYGKHLFKRFSNLYPQFFKQGIDYLGFISHIDQYIHVEVLKLYPDAELPSIDTVAKGENFIELIYTSQRKLSDFALGLLEGAAIHFNEKVLITTQMIEEDGSKVRFLIQKVK